MKSTSSSSLWNLPNKLTMARVALTPVFIVFAELCNHRGSRLSFLLADIVFAVASYTDMLDGKIARSRGIVTDFGKFMDPLADKVLTTTALLYMMDAGVCHPMVLVLVLAREFAVAGLRMVAAGSKSGKVIAANVYGKIKTVAQMLTVLVYYFAAAVFGPVVWVQTLTQALCWLVAALTLLSGTIYLYQNRSFLTEA